MQASFVLSELIAKKLKPDSEGEFVKDSHVAANNWLCDLVLMVDITSSSQS